ncbi:MAG: autoinducer binding domain-containing protein [Candidatus Sedimenticola sp. (ex Thyasira tokunagai)]
MKRIFLSVVNMIMRIAESALWDDVYELEAKLKNAKDMSGIALIAGEFVTLMETESYAFVSLSNYPTSEIELIITNYADDWSNQYLYEKFFDNDPLIDYTKHNVGPQAWNGFPSASVFHAAKPYGLIDGFIKPTTLQTGPTSAFILARSMDPITKNELREKSPFINYFTEMLHDKIREIFSKKGLSLPGVTPLRISHLSLKKAGFTAKEAGKQLHRSPSTIEDSITKLGKALNADGNKRILGEATNRYLI